MSGTGAGGSPHRRVVGAPRSVHDTSGYPVDPTVEQLDRYFHLDETDRRLVEVRRGDHNRLGFAVQLGTVRFLGAFLSNPTNVTPAVAAYVCGQLDLPDPGALKVYAERKSTQWEHAEQIRKAYSYRHFTDPDAQAELIAWLTARARMMADRPGVLVDLATARLLEARVLLPGPSLLERLVAGVRDAAARQLNNELAALVDTQALVRLRGLLVVDPVSRTSSLERLRRGPSSVTTGGLLGALGRLAEIERFGVAGLDLSGLPAVRVAALAANAQARGRRPCRGWRSRDRPRRCSRPLSCCKPTPPMTCLICWTGFWAGCCRAASALSNATGCAGCLPSTSPPGRCATLSRFFWTRPTTGCPESGRLLTAWG